MAADSAATSTSRMRESAAVMFSCIVPKLLMLMVKRFCVAPNEPRCVFKVWMAVSSAEIAACASVATAMLSSLIPSYVASTFSSVNEIRSELVFRMPT